MGENGGWIPDQVGNDKGVWIAPSFLVNGNYSKRICGLVSDLGNINYTIIPQIPLFQNSFNYFSVPGRSKYIVF